MIDRNGKTLCLTHNDLDGAASSMMLANCFPSDKITFYSAKYSDIDEILKTIRFDKYDNVIMTDISPTKDETLIDISPNLYLIDHHPTAEKYNNPDKQRFVNTEYCATQLTHKFCEDYFQKDLSYLEEFVYLVGDYDLWKLVDPRSKQLNDLFFYYWDEKFRRRFFNGDVTFNDEEKKFLKTKEERFNTIWDALDIYPIEGLNAVFCQATEMVNDLCEKLIKVEGYDYVFCRNIKTKSISVRAKDDSVHIGLVMESLKYGGGHSMAAGIDSTPIERMEEVITTAANEIIRQKAMIK